MTEKIIMVASGKGGTGKSTTSVFLGNALAMRGKKVLLVELDSALRSVDIISGVYGKTVYDIQDVLSGKCEGDKAVVESPLYKNLWVISAPYSGGEIAPDALQVFCNKMQEHFDFIVIDTAAGIGLPFLAAASVSDYALIVVTPDPISLRDGRIVSDSLFSQSFEKFRLIINKVDARKIKKSELKNLDECIDTVGAQLIGVICESDEIHNCGTQGKKLSSKGQPGRIFSNIAARICGEEAPLEIS